MEASSYIKALMVQIALQNGLHSGFNGMLGILLCLRNRVRNDDWMLTLTTLSDKPYILIDIRDPEVIKIFTVVDQIYEGTRRDITDGCTYFTTDTNDPKVKGKNYATKIGKLYFYKFEGDVY